MPYYTHPMRQRVYLDPKGAWGALKPSLAKHGLYGTAELLGVNHETLSAWIGELRRQGCRIVIKRGPLRVRRTR